MNHQLFHRFYPSNHAQVPLVIIHGLLGNSRNWHSIATALAQGRPVVTLDLRNHGESSWNDTHDYPTMADDVQRLISHHGWGKVDILGHSMGGKVAMHLALTTPNLMNRLIVVDIAPVNYRHSYDTLLIAMQAMDLAKIERRSQAFEALKSVLQDDSFCSFIVQNLSFDEGKPRWKPNLKALQANIQSIMDFPLKDEKNTLFHGKTLLLHGEQSPYIDPDKIDQTQHFFPHLTIMGQKESGHWPHADNPYTFIDNIKTWLTTTEDQNG